MMITFGTYAGNPIEWQILAEVDGCQLLLSRYVLEAQRFFPDCIYTGWARSSVRKWLHEVFLTEAFTPTEQQRIQTSRLYTPPSPGYKNYGDCETADKLFLLSEAELEQYLPRPEERLSPAEPNAVAYSRELRDFHALLPFYREVQHCWWWLRTPGDEPNQMSVVWADGSICKGGHYVNYERGIRPALRLRG